MREKMLGRVRACSLTSLEALELERTCSKLIKDDSLSIYETTLIKLKEGSRRDLSSIPEESTKTDVNHDMAISSSDEGLMEVDAPEYPRTDTSPSSSGRPSISSSKDHQTQKGNMSVVDMFAKYKSSRTETLNPSAVEDVMVMENDCSSSPSCSR